MKIDKKMKILVVDDHRTMRDIMEKTLRMIGFVNIEKADDGNTALPLLKTNKFDFVISDWNMPIMQGIDLLKAIRADARLGKTPVLLVTAEAKPEQVVEAAKAGVNDYVVKPFTPDILEKKIEKIFSKIKA